MVDQTVKEDLRTFCMLIERYGVLESGVRDVFKECLRAEKAGFRRFKPLSRSIRLHDDALYCVADVDGCEKAVCVVKTPEKAPKVFREESPIRFGEYIVYMIDFNVENLRKLVAEKPELGPRSLRGYPRLGLGVRMLFTLPPLIDALKELDVLSDFQLSAGREFSLKEVVDAKPGLYPEWLGHTGLDAEHLYNTIAMECFKGGLEAYGTEIDHLIITRQTARALTRILTHGEGSAEEGLEDLESSMNYNRRIIDEASATGFVKGITVDASDLIRYEFMDPDRWPREAVRRRFMEEFDGEAEQVLDTVKPGHTYKIGGYELVFTEEEVMRIALKYRLCLLKIKELYEYFRSKVGEDFTYELSLDETPELTEPKELFYCLSECSRMGMPVDLVAPNVGFFKREDYPGRLDELEERVRVLSAIAERFDAVLDFHSGSDKRAEVYRAVSRACGGRLKLKMSTIYQLKYFETLAEFPEGSEERRLFEEIWDYTLDYVKRRASEGDEVAKRQLEEVLKRMGKPGFVKKPDDDFFRYYSFIVVNAKKPSGERIFKERLYRLASKREVRERYRRKVFEVTKMVAEALGLLGSRSGYLASRSARNR